MTDHEDYPAQILLVIARGCRPNSPVDGRKWMNLKPRGGRIPGLGAAMDALIRAGLVERARGWVVKPTPLGYVAVERMKARRAASRARPPLFDPIEAREPVSSPG